MSRLEHCHRKPCVTATTVLMVSYYDPRGPGPRRGLIVEDDSLTRVLLENLLQGFGFDVATAQNASEGKKYLRLNDPDLAIVDIDLGFGPTGLDFAKMMARTHPHVATVFLSRISEGDSGITNTQNLPTNVAYINKLDLDNVEAVREVIEACLQPSLRPRPIGETRPEGIRLSQSQYEVLLQVSRGVSTADIAVQRGTTERAVRGIFRRIQDEHSEVLLDSKSQRNTSAASFLKAYS